MNVSRTTYADAERPALDRWSREALRVRWLASEVGVPLPADALLTWDVRDLLSIAWALEAVLAGGTGWWARRALLARLRGLGEGGPRR